MRRLLLASGFLVILGLGCLPLPGSAATIVVTTNGDADLVDGACSLREAIQAANADAVHADCPAGSGADRIVFDFPFPDSIVLGADLPVITSTLAVRGPGADLLAIDGDDAFEPVVLDAPTGQGAWLLLEDFTIQRGFAHTFVVPAIPMGGGVRVGPGDTALLVRMVIEENGSLNAGGGIAVDGHGSEIGRITLRRTTVAGNVAQGAAGGGGLYVTDASEAEIFDSAFVLNHAAHDNAPGGGIQVQRGALRMLRSTVSQNLADAGGGGIALSANSGDVDVELVECTVALNQADADGIDLNSNDLGGGLLAFEIAGTLALRLENSIVALNLGAGATSSDDVQLEPALVFTSGGTNLVGNHDGGSVQLPAGTPNAADDFVGSAASPIDPLLLALEAAPGETPHHRPQLDAASPVIDHGRCPDSPADQRDRGRITTRARIVDHPGVANHALSDGCDIGSIERAAGFGPNAPDIFADAFELGHALVWSAESP